ncbi:hypothetical protein ACSAZK_01790 [Methanosarcina sp. Mfa9]|uniref:hypothetical protein n=1 Tax=Methanosarcina sp. Mfa9 TaxID=3439063 RepID=UPI003F871777
MTAAMVASVLEVESCEILKFPQTIHSSTTEQPPSDHEFAGGISVLFKIQGTSPRVITLHIRRQREFTQEDVHFLVAVLTLLTKILEYGKFDRKLRSRILFLETLLEIIPSPIFFRDRKGVSVGSNDLFSRHVADFSRYRRKGVSGDDILDALVAAFTAKIGQMYGFEYVPADPETDAEGLRIQLVYCNHFERDTDSKG